MKNKICIQYLYPLCFQIMVFDCLFGIQGQAFTVLFCVLNNSVSSQITVQRFVEWLIALIVVKIFAQP